MNLLCDTDILIDYFNQSNSRHHQKVIIQNDVIGLKNIVISAITKMELMIGIKNKEAQNKLIKNLRGFNLSLINNEITSQAIHLIQDYKLSYGLTIPDSIIAATGLITDLQLFTYNRKDFDYIKGLKTYNAALTK